MKIKTIQSFSHAVYFIFASCILLLVFFSFLIGRPGEFVMLLGILGVMSLPAMITGTIILLLVALITFIKKSFIERKFKILAVITILYLPLIFITPYLPWGGSEIAEVIGPIGTVISLMYGLSVMYLLFNEDTHNNTLNRTD